MGVVYQMISQEKEVTVKPISDYILELQIKSSYNILVNSELKDICLNSFDLEYAKEAYYDLCKSRNVESLFITHYLAVFLGFNWNKGCDSKGNNINSLQIINLTKGL